MQQDDAEKDAIKWNKKKEGHKKQKTKNRSNLCHLFLIPTN
jgi:hypothetical protein